MSIALDRMYREYPATISKVLQLIGSAISCQSSMTARTEEDWLASYPKTGKVSASAWIAIR